MYRVQNYLAPVIGNVMCGTNKSACCMENMLAVACDRGILNIVAW